MHYYYFCLFQLFSIQKMPSWILCGRLSHHQRAHQFSLNNEGVWVSVWGNLRVKVEFSKLHFHLCLLCVCGCKQQLHCPTEGHSDVFCGQLFKPGLRLSLVLWISSSWENLADTRSLFSKGDWYYLKYFKSKYILASVSAGTCNFTD